MPFEWDAQKARQNADKHGVTFEECCDLFFDYYISRPDTRRNYGEDRFNAIGIANGQVFHVSYTLRNAKIRIISARKASKLEREFFNKTINTP